MLKIFARVDVGVDCRVFACAVFLYACVLAPICIAKCRSYDNLGMRIHKLLSFYIHLVFYPCMTRNSCNPLFASLIGTLRFTTRQLDDAAS